jgi:hypothetical protein
MAAALFSLIWADPCFGLPVKSGLFQTDCSVKHPYFLASTSDALLFLTSDALLFLIMKDQQTLYLYDDLSF